MTVEQGMDTARARGIADQLGTQGSALDAIGAQGSAMMQLLNDVWSGPDTEQFAREWQSARPRIDRAGQALTDMGRELRRQADQQDVASEGAGLGPGGPTPPGLPLPPIPPLPIPRLPSLPDIFAKVNEIIADIVGFVRSWIAVPMWVSDLFTWLDEAFKIFRNSPLTRLIFKGLGRVTPFLSAVLGLWDIGESIYRFFTEGFTKDSVLQFFQGLTGTIGAGLGIAALFAGGTIIGLPAAAVLGAGALIFGAISIGIGIYREFDDEIDQFVRDNEEIIRWALRPGPIGTPGFPLPMPQFPPPTVPVPELPDWPGAPNPTIPVPELPSLPGIPTPTFPGVPSLPGMPSIPTLPKPALPGLPIPKLW